MTCYRTLEVGGIMFEAGVQEKLVKQMACELSASVDRFSADKGEIQKKREWHGSGMS